MEVSIDQGENWETAELFKPGVRYDNSKTWTWALWKFEFPDGIQEETTIWARAFDECCNTQPRDIHDIWNYRGCCNNSIQKYTVKPLLPKETKL